MSEKKFLSAEGVTTLWGKILENFPNNEIIAEIVNSIDEVKTNVSDFISNSEIDEICV